MRGRPAHRRRLLAASAIGQALRQHQLQVAPRFGAGGDGEARPSAHEHLLGRRGRIGDRGERRGQRPFVPVGRGKPGAQALETGQRRARGGAVSPRDAHQRRLHEQERHRGMIEGEGPRGRRDQRRLGAVGRGGAPRDLRVGGCATG